MRWTLGAVGKPRDRTLDALARGYADRLRAGTSLDFFSVREGQGSPDEVRGAESAALEKSLKQVDRVVVLDERGELLGSEALARKLDSWALSGASRVAFLIGGAFGHDQALRERADWLWSLSPLTFPHELARLLVAEQLYRAWTIQRGDPYHKR